MEITKKVVRPATEEDVVVGMKCDLCGKLYSKEDGYDYCTTKIKLEAGTNYGYTGNYDKYWVDLCSDCFSDKLIPWLQEQGCKIQQKDDTW